MGKYNQGILGPFTGKVGAIVGSSWRGVNYIKSLPGPNASNSEAQQKQRSRFKSVVSLASSLMESLIRPVWNLVGGKMTGYNLFVKTNMPAFDESGALVNYSDFHASMGALPLPEILTLQDDADVVSGIELSWKDDSATGVGNADDKLHLLVMTPERVHILNTASVRSDQSAEITLPVAAGNVHVYAFFGTADGAKFSADFYSLVVLS
ncbi:hypothetical protein DWB61_15260 [Ancylomarina euxinus]|uniref:Uncharacterized protein n=1 Tax=Ancylomarina euxinus TaxID=2283627 RepID=A0A425XXK0_9BACT|nr:DUF6266 family protein [Ancylomarina euxinus]MCZ4694710.1 DUF6266 family protein [Ancylomarina euxinus]MUP16374.1 hypothetical protein [Ancylomarina euxinus]RRG19405.1 hypothetical protein DWB61_15260 [Ancylomarina euxinus]